MTQKSTKKNASIMFTDIVNFTHFMSVDEKKALNFLEHKKSILNQLVQSYNGEYIKDIGDGYTEAVLCRDKKDSSVGPKLKKEKLDKIPSDFLKIWN